MPIYSLVHCTTAGESASTDSLKYFILCLKSAMVAGEMEVNNLYKTFLDFFL